MMSSMTIRAAAAAAALSLAVAGCSTAPSQPAPPPPTQAEADAIAAGTLISIQVCGFCQRNSLTVPTRITSLVRSNAAGE